MDEERIPEIILAIRMGAQLSQGALAEALGVSTSTISGWETGDRVPKKVNWALIKERFPWIEEENEGSDVEKREGG